MIKIYTLLLDNMKYYIGQTRNIDHRFEQHKQGKLGSEWTKENSPIKVLEVIDTPFEINSEAMFLENSITFEYMKKYGWRNVRGGDFCTLNEEKLRFLLCNNSDFGSDIIPIINHLRFNLNTHGVFIYAMKLNMDKYFVGIAKNLKLSIIREYNGLGYSWCKLYEPSELLYVKNISQYPKEDYKDLVNNEVIKVMKETHWGKVRGGDYYEAKEIKHRNKVLKNTDIKIVL